MVPTKYTYHIDKGSAEDDAIYLSSIFESRKDAPTKDTWLHYTNNESAYYDPSTKILHRYNSGRLQARL
jgi:hypothetical protein